MIEINHLFISKNNLKHFSLEISQKRTQQSNIKSGTHLHADLEITWHFLITIKMFLRSSLWRSFPYLHNTKSYYFNLEPLTKNSNISKNFIFFQNASPLQEEYIILGKFNKIRIDSINSLHWQMWPFHLWKTRLKYAPEKQWQQMSTLILLYLNNVTNLQFSRS